MEYLFFGKGKILKDSNQKEESGKETPSPRIDLSYALNGLKLSCPSLLLFILTQNLVSTRPVIGSPVATNPLQDKTQGKERKRNGQPRSSLANHLSQQLCPARKREGKSLLS